MNCIIFMRLTACLSHVVLFFPRLLQSRVTMCPSVPVWELWTLIFEFSNSSSRPFCVTGHSVTCTIMANHFQPLCNPSRALKGPGVLHAFYSRTKGGMMSKKTKSNVYLASYFSPEGKKNTFFAKKHICILASLSSRMKGFFASVPLRLKSFLFWLGPLHLCISKICCFFFILANILGVSSGVLQIAWWISKRGAKVMIFKGGGTSP